MKYSQTILAAQSLALLAFGVNTGIASNELAQTSAEIHVDDMT